MSKKILVVTGSARRNGNSDQLAQAFARGAQKAGHHVTLFSAAQSASEVVSAAIYAGAKAVPASRMTI